MTQDCLFLEQQGLPTVVLAGIEFEEMIAHLTKSRGMPELRRILFPVGFEALPPAELSEKVAVAAEEIAAMLRPVREGVAP